MAEIVSHTVLAGEGNSGDAVRVVTDATFCALRQECNGIG